MRIFCPVCHREVTLNLAIEDIPYFGEIMLTSMTCACGFKHADYVILGVKEPVRYRVKVDPTSLFFRVIRSTSGTIRIPELGIDIEPGPASLAYITNVEGVLHRIRDILNMVEQWEDREKVERAHELLHIIDEILSGRYEVTLIVEDPFGNSAIIGEGVEREMLSVEEASKLKTGMTVIDVAGVENEDDLLG